MRIIWVGPLPPHQGGTAIAAYQLLDGLAAVGHHIRVIAPSTPPSRGDTSFFGTVRDDIAIHWFPMPYMAIDPFQPEPPDYRAQQQRLVVDQLRRLIAHARPDVIVVGRSTFVWGAPDVARSCGIPCVLWVHVSIEAEQQRNEPAYMASMLTELRKLTSIITCAEHMVGGFRALGFDNVVAVPNGIDTELFRPGHKDETLRSKLGIAPAQPVALHASNLKPIKRPLDIVECAVALSRRCPELIWLIVGDGPCREEMQNLACGRGVLDRFRFAGWVCHRQLATYVTQADIAVMPSESECMALAYLEAMACGVPVVASNLPASREALRDGVTGVLHCRGDIADMADKIAGILAAPGRRHMGVDARAWVLAHHDIADSAARFSASVTAASVH